MSFSDLTHIVEKGESFGWDGGRREGEENDPTSSTRTAKLGQSGYCLPFPLKTSFAPTNVDDTVEAAKHPVDRYNLGG